VDHTLFIAAGFRKVLNEAEVCGYKNEIIIEDFFHKYYDHIFNLIPYNHFYSAFDGFLNTSLNFIWYFLDLFIILVSIGISFRFEQINRRVEFYRGKFAPDLMCCEIRSHYTELCELLKKIDDKIGYLICMASLNDFYFLISNILNASE
jgi:gustatory receptor